MPSKKVFIFLAVITVILAIGLLIESSVVIVEWMPVLDICDATGAIDVSYGFRQENSYNYKLTELTTRCERVRYWIAAASVGITASSIQILSIALVLKNKTRMWCGLILFTALLCATSLALAVDKHGWYGAGGAHWKMENILGLSVLAVVDMIYLLIVSVTMCLVDETQQNNATDVIDTQQQNNVADAPLPNTKMQLKKDIFKFLAVITVMLAIALLIESSVVIDEWKEALDMCDATGAINVSYGIRRRIMVGDRVDLFTECENVRYWKAAASVGITASFFQILSIALVVLDRTRIWSGLILFTSILCAASCGLAVDKHGLENWEPHWKVKNVFVFTILALIVMIYSLIASVTMFLVTMCLVDKTQESNVMDDVTDNQQKNKVVGVTDNQQQNNVLGMTDNQQQNNVVDMEQNDGTSNEAHK